MTDEVTSFSQPPLRPDFPRPPKKSNIREEFKKLASNHQGLIAIEQEIENYRKKEKLSFVDIDKLKKFKIKRAKIILELWNKSYEFVLRPRIKNT